MTQCIYRFQIRALTEPGETVALVGSIPEMGCWDLEQRVTLQTQPDCYPLWWVDLDLQGDDGSGPLDSLDPTAVASRVDYKYLRLKPDGQVGWEAWGVNRWVPLEPGPLPSPILVEDGSFGTIPPYPYGYFAEPVPETTTPPDRAGLKVVVIGSSVAMGCSAWLLRGWAWHLGQALQQHYGHRLVNRAELGANVSRTIARFSSVVAPERPDIVIIALSLGNEGLASCAPAHRKAVQRRFENGLQHLVKMTRDVGAYPVLGGVYPHGDYSSEHYDLLQQTHQRMVSWGVPVLDWLGVLADDQGRWQAGTAWDVAHPNTRGHGLMFEAIDLSWFQPSQVNLPAPAAPPADRPIFQDHWGFHMFAHQGDNSLRVVNATPHPYTIDPGWQVLQNAFRMASVSGGLYAAERQMTDQGLAGLVSLFVDDHGAIATRLTIPPGADLVFYPVFHFLGSPQAQILFHDGALSLLKVGEHRLYVFNESDHEYNIQPMWQEVRAALKGIPPGVYEDSIQPEAAFRTLMIGSEGLESRVKAPPQSALALDYQCSLEQVNRVAIIPLGDRCAVRMLLYKLEYDGPAFPFDLTRTTHLADVADMIDRGFQEMWNPAFLHYDHEAKRIYHTKWTGLSFAHEVEECEDPVHDMMPVYQRMEGRYRARARRFWYTLKTCDKALFVRTGVCDRNAVVDLLQKLEAKCLGKPFRLLLLSPQDGEPFADLPKVLHYNLEFNPDLMYDDLNHWLACTRVMGGILKSLGISSRNLFWCPPNVPDPGLDRGVAP